MIVPCATRLSSPRSCRSACASRGLSARSAPRRRRAAPAAASGSSARRPATPSAPAAARPLAVDQEEPRRLAGGVGAPVAAPGGEDERLPGAQPQRLAAVVELVLDRAVEDEAAVAVCA